MKTVFEHIEHIKGKPHHIRKGIAFAAAAIGAGVIGLIWLVGTINAGTFALQGSTFADNTAQEGATTGAENINPNNIAGAAAALGNEDAPAQIEIVDISSSTRSEKSSERTVIPF